MNETAHNGTDAQSDMLLWIAAGAVAAIAIAWFVVSRMGVDGPSAQAMIAEPAGPAAAVTAARPAPTAPARDSEPALGGPGLDNPLRAAQMAYEAGMLTEPADYSAWTLFGVALEANPDNAPARQGLEQVAAELLERGTSAVEQGRYDDATAIADTILARLPAHAGAEALRGRIAAEQEAQRTRERERAAARAVQVDRPAVDRPGGIEAPSVDRAQSAGTAASTEQRLAELQTGFADAVAANRLLTPADDSAKYFVLELRRVDADDERTTAAMTLLTTEMLGRSHQAAEATDWAAAETWIQEAAALGADPQAVVDEQLFLTRRMAAAETAKRLPASALTLVSYVAPEFPRMALTRGVEGWVDVDFRVMTNGRTTDVSVTDASHDRLFQEEAIEAVSDWQFEPRLFRGQPIDQNAYTRVRFVFDD